MRLRWFEKSSNRICNCKAEITFIEDYKQRTNKSITKKPAKIVLNRRNVLLGICRKRQQFNEIKTVQAVENCRSLASEHIERFFEQKERALNNLPEITVGIKSYSNVFNNNDLKELYEETEQIISDNLFQRFNSLTVWKPMEVNSDRWIDDIFSPVPKYLETKNRTVLSASYMEALSRRILSESIESLMANSIIAKLVCNFDISATLLPKLGINSDLEMIESKKELFKRMSGALNSIKIHLIQEINKRIADIFYEIHDSHLESAIELKIRMFEKKMAADVYQTELLEA